MCTFTHPRQCVDTRYLRSGVDFFSPFLPYGDRRRLHRRFFHQSYRIDVIQRFAPLQHDKGRQLLRQLLTTPRQFDEHVFGYVSDIVILIITISHCVEIQRLHRFEQHVWYGHDPQSYDEELIQIAEKMPKIILSAARPAVAVIVDTFPIRE